MKGLEMKILFKEDMAFLTEDVALDFNQVQVSERPVRLRTSACWTIRIINYIESKNWLFVDVISHRIGETEFSDIQIKLADILSSIEKVTFKNIDTTALLTTFEILPLQDTANILEPPRQPEIEIAPVIKTYQEPFSIPIKNVTFLFGMVTFEKKIQALGRIVEFQISNENIIQEYDAVKNYFTTVLKTKKIQVVPTIVTVDGTVTSINATSIEIGKIDKTLIEEVKFEIVTASRRKESARNKQLFTMDEYVETFISDIPKAKQFFNDETDFFKNLIDRSGTKHYHHLRFLSSKHRYDRLKLRFVHKPFSFVFLLGGINKFHIVWETLDTQEATYIWTVSNDLNDIVAQLDQTINLIITEGKNDYINRNEEGFSRVFHDYTDVQNGFKNWKTDFEKILNNETDYIHQ